MSSPLSDLTAAIIGSMGLAASANLDRWLAKAVEHPGSWWPDWLAWLTAQGAAQVPARIPGGGQIAPIEDAPGSFVKVKG